MSFRQDQHGSATWSHRLKQEITIIRLVPVQRTRSPDRIVPVLAAPCLPCHDRLNRPIPQQYRHFPWLLYTRTPLPASDPQSASQAMRRPKHDRARGLGGMVEARYLPIRPSLQPCSSCSPKGMTPIGYLREHHGGASVPAGPLGPDVQVSAVDPGTGYPSCVGSP